MSIHASCTRPQEWDDLCDVHVVSVLVARVKVDAVGSPSTRLSPTIMKVQEGGEGVGGEKKAEGEEAGRERGKREEKMRERREREQRDEGKTARPSSVERLPRAPSAGEKKKREREAKLAKAQKA